MTAMHRFATPTPSTGSRGTVAAPFNMPRLVRLMGDWCLGDGVLHAQLADQLRRLVVQGKLATGIRLPSERSLAVALGVSRNTVAAAFDQLRGDGILTSRRGDGTYVSSARQHVSARGDDRLQSFMPTQDPSTRIDLRSAALPGLPLVVEEMQRSLTEHLQPLVASHGYLPSGLPALKEEVAHYYSQSGLATTADQIVITTGAQQAMRIAAVSMLEPGSIVLVEEPSFRGAIEMLRATGASLMPIERGPLGIDLDTFREAVARYKPALLVLQSTVHNPTGGVMDVARRRRLAVEAEAMGLPILDDTAMADALIDGPQPTPMAAFGTTVLTVGSVSKSFWGGLRVGWLRVDRRMAPSMASIKAGEDLGTSLLAQVVTARLLPRIDEARAERRVSLTQKRAVALTGVADLLPEWHPVVPLGGASLWVELPVPASVLVAQYAQRLGVQVLPGTTFSCVDGLDSYLRISIANASSELLIGLELLARAWRDVAPHFSPSR